MSAMIQQVTATRTAEELFEQCRAANEQLLRATATAMEMIRQPQPPRRFEAEEQDAERWDGL